VSGNDTPEAQLEYKAERLERDFGVLHPRRKLRAGLRRRDDYHEVTPLHAHVARERIEEIEARGFEREDAFTVLLMRGARIETVAKGAGEAVEELAAQVRAHLRKIDPTSLYEECWRGLNLMDRS
jgi:hypothetical protein